MKSILTAFAVLFSVTQFTGQAQALPIHQKMDFKSAEAFFNQSAQYNYLGIVKLNNCSGALVKFENSKDSDSAMVLSNGHCVSTGMFGGMIKPNTAMVHQKAVRSFQFLKTDGELMSGSVKSTEVLYATMTGTDISLYSLDSTYAQIKKQFGVDAIVIDSQHPTTNTEIDILSGYWQRGYSCKIDAFVFELHEENYVSKDSIRYSPEGCHTIHGTSGSPILSHATGKIIGINNTGNDDGEKCTMDNPCEVSADGGIFYKKGLSYGQETYQIYTCLDSNGKLDLSRNGCMLFHN
ncbi:MAG: trypsin-like peptidase domain-containing protein [Bdellovibrionales bacterium]|nr:trypsin-like peptidase domain-containing protein [Oligoflexia bacterium]